MASDWDDLRLVLAVSRGGSLSAAARGLGLNQSTVSRRIRTFEQRVGVRLFEPLPTGFAPTPAGEEVVAAAERMERELLELDRRVFGRDAALVGTIRVALADAITPRLVPILAAFRKLYPGILLELVSGPGIANLSRREADVAIRSQDQPAPHLRGRRIGGLAMAAYASHRYLASRHDLRPEALDWIAWDEMWSSHPSSRWLAAHVPRERIVCRSTTTDATIAAIHADIGVGFVVSWVGDTIDDFARVTEPDTALAGTLWLLIHEDLRAVPRFHAFMSFVGDALNAEQEAIAGVPSGVATQPPRPHGQKTDD